MQVIKMILDSKKTKEIEEICVANGTEHIELMTRAGNAVAKVASEQFDAKNKSVAVVCGRGHNGGDGFVTARTLAKSGAKVRLLLTHGYPNVPDAIDLFGRAERAGMKCLLYNVEEDRDEFLRTLSIADVIVDAVCGTGFKGELDENLQCIFECINSSKARVVSIDLPSGVHADSGKVAKGAVKADVTVTFTSKKPCHVIYPGLEHCGRVFVADIGIDISSVPISDSVLEIPDFQTTRLCFPQRKKNTHKGTYGKLLAICGSESMPGAAALAVKAAVRSGVGLVKCVTPEKCILPIVSNAPECTFAPIQSKPQYLNENDREMLLEELKGADSCLIGCGMGVSDRTRQIIEIVIENAKCPLVIDADALNCISENTDILKKVKSESIITPHPGEMARLIGCTTEDVQNDRLETARSFSEKYNITVVLKGANTIISIPDTKIFVNETGNPGMACAGSGDVLAGIIGSLLAQGKNVSDAVSCGVYIHGECGDRAEKKLSFTAMTPSDMIEMLPLLFIELER